MNNETRTGEMNMANVVAGKTKMTKLTNNEINALKTIAKAGRSTDKRAVSGLVKKNIVRVVYEQQLVGDWSNKGAMAYFCSVIADQ